MADTSLKKGMMMKRAQGKYPAPCPRIRIVKPAMFVFGPSDCFSKGRSIHENQKRKKQTNQKNFWRLLFFRPPNTLIFSSLSLSLSLSLCWAGGDEYKAICVWEVWGRKSTTLGTLCGDVLDLWCMVCVKLFLERQTTSCVCASVISPSSSLSLPSLSLSLSTPSRF